MNHHKTTRIKLLKLILLEVRVILLCNPSGQYLHRTRKKKSPTEISADTFLHLPPLSLFHSLECYISQHFTTSTFPYQQSDISVHGTPLPMDRQVWHMTYLLWRFEKLWFLALGISKFGNGFIYHQPWIKAVKLLWKHGDGPLKESCATLQVK